ncbi:uncharacterized protein LOC108224661 isoform X2 [Daucus carota subsp. sativus]|uniref:uncharacterized protein LOC108224661 isoform X2 n=1 Tax=Daucus carota subsp. sativus TaxID=79200 RepID=UPI0007F04440|nr:PREDICTED: uncharacterized protein LOC108224661 isoform X2 [Daucus carota subsp. sativus]
MRRKSKLLINKNEGEMSSCSCFLSRYLTTNYPIHHIKFPTTLISLSPNSRFVTCSLSKKISLSVAEVEEDDVLHDFIKDRAMNGDFITQVTDSLWLRDAKDILNAETGLQPDSSQISKESIDEESEGGFLKLKRTTEWLLGDNTAPVNKKVMIELKKELLLLTVGIGTACSGYCLIALSFQAAVSYATGVLFSCLYLQLLCQRADKISQDEVPQIFRQKKTKKIGIRSQDLEDSFEKFIKGSSIALSSPRLVIPAVIYGLWGLSQHFTKDIFDFQLVPAMVGIFAYKAAALVQVYRDNEDLQLIFPEDNE